MLCYVLRHSLVARLERLIKTFSNTAAPVTHSDVCHTEILSSITISHGLVAKGRDALYIWPNSLMQWCTNLAVSSAAPLWQSQYYMRHTDIGEALLTFKQAQNMNCIICMVYGPCCACFAGIQLTTSHCCSILTSKASMCVHAHVAYCARVVCMWICKVTHRLRAMQ
jgi:hypothetical protein